MKKVFPPAARLLAALRFLTVFPLPGGKDDARYLAESVPYFPVVGLLLGTVGAGCAWLIGRLFPAPVGAVLLTGLLAGFSGGLHLDGLADTADGFLSSRPQEQILVIMRDSRIGAMGVVALVLLLMLKAGALAALHPVDLVPALLLMPLAGRCAIVILMALLPYARSEGGLAGVFYRQHSRKAAFWAAACFILACLLVLGWQRTLVLSMVNLLLLTGFARLCRGVIGGATGDTLGAGCELCELGVALGLTVSCFGQGGT